MMRIYPAIDLLNGHCVRLHQGDFAQPVIYSQNPVETAVQFALSGLQYLHVVDLNGAQQGRLHQLAIVKDIIAHSGLQIQMGGGVRTLDDVESLLNIGVDRVILGSAVIMQMEFVQNCLQIFGREKIVLAIDVFSTQNYQIAISGWQQILAIDLWDVLTTYNNGQTENILCTDIAKDGMLSGPNFSMYQRCINDYSLFDPGSSQQVAGLRFIASGGISCAEDIQKLRQIGLHSVIVGKALYEQKVSLAWLQNELSLV